MYDKKKQTALVTGASSGIGEATAVALLGAGYRVYAAARRVERMQRLGDLGVRVLSLDVTDDSSLIAAIEAIREEAGMVDVLVNNAGYGSYGALEDVPMKEARAQMEVNVIGLARLAQLVIPAMREARQGAIVNVSSMGGQFGEAFGAWYHATKYAVEGLSDSMALELAPFGIRVVAVEPGAIKTEWASIAADNLLHTSGNGAYADAAKSKAVMFKRVNEIAISSPPDVVAKAIVKILHMRNPKLRYAVGGGAKPLLFLRKVTSDRLFYRILAKLMS